MTNNHRSVRGGPQAFYSKRRVAADYDGLSRECGAVASWNGWFVLAPPSRYAWRTDGVTAGNALRRKRQSLREDVARQIQRSLAG